MQFYISGALPQIPAPLTLITSIIQPNDSSSLRGHAGDGIKEACRRMLGDRGLRAHHRHHHGHEQHDACYTHPKQCDQKYSESSGATDADLVTGTISNHY